MLMTCVGTIGRASVWLNERPVVFFRSVAIIRPKPFLLPEFLEYVIRSPDFQAELRRRTKKASQGGVYLKDIKGMPIAVPSVGEQERLVKLLDEADALRKLRAEADRREEAFIPALFEEMFGDPATNPKRWPKKPVGEVCVLVNGTAFKPVDWDGAGLPIVRIQNLNDASKPFNYTSKVLSEKFRVRPGDILLSWSGTPGTSFGCFRWNGPEGWLNQHIFNVYLRSGVDGEFFIQSVNARLGELIALAHGGVGLQHVTKGTLNSVELLIPPLTLQREFAGCVESTRALREEQATSGSRLDGLFQSMLHRAFTGEL